MSENQVVPKKKRLELWQILLGLFAISLVLLTVPLIYHQVKGELNPTMHWWTIINSIVTDVLLLGLYVMAVKKKKPKLWQALAGLLMVLTAILVHAIMAIKFTSDESAFSWWWTRTIGLMMAVTFITLVIAYQRQVAAKYKSSKLSEITLYSYPKLVYLWPVILLGFAFNWPFGCYQWLSPTALGWWYLVAMMTVFLTTCIDLNRVATLLWLSLVAIITLGYFLVSVTVGETFLDSIGRFFAGLTPSYPTSWAMAFSVIALIPYLIMIIGVRINGKWFISHNQFEHRTLFGKDDSLARGAKRVKAIYSDILELLLLGSGTLIIYSAQGRGDIVLAEIHNIPFLFFRMGKIDRILESTQVDTAAEEEAGESDHAEDSSGDHA